MKWADRLFNLDPIRIEWKQQEYQEYRKYVNVAAVGSLVLVAANIAGVASPSDIAETGMIAGSVLEGAGVAGAIIKAQPLKPASS